MATGDVLSVTVLPNGWEADIVVEGLSTGGSFLNGFGASNDPRLGTPTLSILVTDLGYVNGSQVNTTRRCYATTFVRQPFPNDALKQESVSGGNLTFRVSLSGKIFAKSGTGPGGSGVNPVATVLSGLYSGINPTTITCVNGSTESYPVVIANWTWPGFEIFDASSKLRCYANHHFGKDGRPVNCVKFTVTDGTTTNTEFVYAPTVDKAFGDAVPVVEYITQSDLSAGLTQGAVLTMNFVAYPWVGDSGATVDSSTGAVAPGPLVGPIKSVCDRTGAFGRTYVLVDPLGSDTLGTAYDSAVFNPATAVPCLTINGACVKAAAYNNTNRSRNDLGGVIIYLNDGTYVWTGASGAIGTTPNCVVTVTRSANSTNRSSVVIGTASGDADLTDRVLLKDVKITATTNLSFNTIDFLWFDKCDIDQTGVSSAFAMVYNPGNWNVTRCNVTIIQQGLRAFGTQNNPLCICRGNTVGSFIAKITPYTCVGNSFTNPLSTSQWGGPVTGTLAPAQTNVIFAYNKVMSFSGTNGLLNFNSATVWSGISFTQNLIEYINSGSTPLVQIAADISTASCVNVHFHYNTTVGQRVNIGYNDDAASAPLRNNFSLVGNIAEDINVKTDNNHLPNNSARVNNWEHFWGTLSHGNYLPEILNVGAPAGFNFEFPGLRSFQPVSASASTITKFVNRAAGTSAGAGAGNGDYRLQNSSPAIRFGYECIIPFDLDGNPRWKGDAAGCYSNKAFKTSN